MSTTTATAWTTELRENAARQVAEGALPDRSAEEAWRKVDLSILDAKAFASTESGSNSSFSLKGEGCEQIPLADALNGGGDLAAFVEESLRHYADPEHASFFTARNTVAASERVLRLSGTSPETIHVRHVPNDPSANTVAPRTMIYVESGAEVTLLEEYAFAPATEDADSLDIRLVTPMTDVYCAPGSRLNYVMIGDFGPGDFHVHHFRSRQLRDSRLNTFLFPLSGTTGKHFYRNEAVEPGAECRMVGCAVGINREFNDMDIRMEHHADHTQSSILYRSVVRDRSHHVFYGNLHIAPGLKDVDSHQTNNNILLNRRARAESMPNLIIRAEDVSAEHGATVGELDADALYFLMARGIPEEHARALLIEGFINSVLQEVPDETLRGEIDERLKKRLA